MNLTTYMKFWTYIKNLIIYYHQQDYDIIIFIYFNGDFNNYIRYISKLKIKFPLVETLEIFTTYETYREKYITGSKYIYGFLIPRCLVKHINIFYNIPFDCIVN